MKQQAQKYCPRHADQDICRGTCAVCGGPLLSYDPEREELKLVIDFFTENGETAYVKKTRPAAPPVTLSRWAALGAWLADAWESLSFKVEPRDIWVGFYVDTKERVIYCCPLPCLCLSFGY